MIQDRLWKLQTRDQFSSDAEAMEMVVHAVETAGHSVLSAKCRYKGKTPWDKDPKKFYHTYEIILKLNVRSRA